MSRVSLGPTTLRAARLSFLCLAALAVPRGEAAAADIGFGEPLAGYREPYRARFHPPAPVYGRRAYEGPVYMSERAERGRCRVVVKERENEFGEVTIRRLRICEEVVEPADGRAWRAPGSSDGRFGRPAPLPPRNVPDLDGEPG